MTWYECLATLLLGNKHAFFNNLVLFRSQGNITIVVESNGVLSLFELRRCHQLQWQHQLKAIATTTQKMPPTRGSGRQDINRRNLEPESFRSEDRQTRRHHTISYLLYGDHHHPQSFVSHLLFAVNMKTTIARQETMHSRVMSLKCQF